MPMLIGSRALDFWMGSCSKEDLYRRKTDWDFIVDEEEYLRMRNHRSVSNEKIERHDLSHLNNLQMYGHYSMSAWEITLKGFGKVLIAPLEMLYVLKRSHAWRVRSFEKTMCHLYKEGLVNYKPKDNSWGQHLLEERTKITMKEYPQRNPNLNQSVEDFFDDPVNKKYDHDWMHTLYAHEMVPMYTRMQPDPKSAWCDKNMWLDSMSRKQRSLCVAEECYVIATERFMVPKDYRFPSKLAFHMALNKVCTTLCSGWFRDWAIDHYDEIHDLYDPNRFIEVEVILNKEGHLHPHKQKEDTTNG